ncbi:iron complex outermembrane receptor protein [Povalibacter uvarum]|uniref:Iron complex outermembrane receptor protein n=1 Tax=Povalibacter uvarum TaxID=732238 RepID=A0A841HWZ1_9GAMM|nr:TonB-dependent receptor [Povalibacter uvarum]MBB6096472.1 iron complex outermembrane receptor protein [Povalibacter uvarum]
MRNWKMKSMSRFGMALLSSAATLVPMHAMAQAADQTAQLDNPLEEVMVTARRREESLQEVPLSIAALSSEQLQVRGIDNTESLNRMVPNVTIASTNFFGRQGGSFRMRGLPNVGIYVDGIVNSSSAGTLMNIVEVERVEVLRGPQGTLFGKNVIGGAVQYVTQRPQDTFGARVKATMGSYDRLDIAANVDIPLSETLLTKLTAAKLSRDGFLPSTTIDQSFGSQDDTTGRLDVLWQPTDGFNWRVVAGYDQQRTNGNPSTVWALNPVCPGDPNPPANFPGGAPNFPCVYENAGLPINQDYVYGARGEMKTASDYNGPELYTTVKSLSTEINFDLTDTWSTKFIGSHRKIETTAYADFDGTPYHIFDGANYSEPEESTAELQFIYGGDRLHGTSGFYYYDNKGYGRRINWLANDLKLEVDPVRNALASAYVGRFFFAPVIDQLAFTSTEGWAVFAEWTYDFTDKLSLTAGARYNEDKVHNAQYNPQTPVSVECCTPVLSVATDGGAPRPGTDLADKWDNLAPRVSLQYQWTSDIMTYLTYSEGFNQGGVNNVNGLAIPYNPETLKNYEFGLRTDLFDRRLRFNLSAFYGQYEDIQVSEEIIPRFPTTTNAGEAEVKGLEVEGMWLVTDNFTINYGFGWLDSEYTDLGTSTAIPLGEKFPYAPDTSYSVGAQYQWDLANSGGLMLRADYGWQDEIQTAADIQKSIIPAYGLLGARLMYTAPGGKWDVALFGSNLTDEYYRINGFYIPTDQMDNGTLGRPREWGVTFGFRFE